MARNRYDVDEALEDHFDIKQLKRLGGYVKPYFGKMFIIMLLMLSSSALTMLIPKFVQLEMDRYIPQKDMNGIIRLVIYTLLIRDLFDRLYVAQDRSNDEGRTGHHS